MQNVAGIMCESVCSTSPDQLHHATSVTDEFEKDPLGGKGSYTWATCTYCHERFKVYASDLQQSYDKQVKKLHNKVVVSGASLHCYPSSFVNMKTVRSLSEIEQLKYVHSPCGCSRTFPDSYHLVEHVHDDHRHLSHYNLYFQVPVSGNYYVSWPEHIYSGTGRYFYEWGSGLSSERYAPLYYPNESYLGPAISSRSIYFDSSIIYGFQVYSALSHPASGWGINNIYVDLIPDEEFFSGTVISSDDFSTRPTSITGNYGIIGDNGQITQVTDNSSIVNETTNQFFNPATGESATISDWSYNYEDRSYTVTTETGDTVTVTYGDENITIVQGGDTYNIYYMVPGGSGTPGPDSCAHNWQETDKTEPTCVTAGKTVSTCSLCGKTKTDPIPAAGHTWVVERTVQTSYDDEGNLLQQGYTIYQCSVCGEQYKDTQSTGPPGGTEEDKSLWEQLGDLIGSGIGGILELAGAILGKILDALTSLVEMITDKLKGIVEGILAIFDELPALFGGFLDFLGALFPYLPEEIMTLLTFGIIAIVFIGILKAVRR